MSLQVWLPLTGDLHNQGLNSIQTIVNGTTTFQNNGKIGKCLSCDGSSYWAINPIVINNEASICCWCKTSINGKMPWVIESVSSNRLNLYYNTNYYLNTGDGENNPFQDDVGNNIPVNTDDLWHHITVTFGSNICKLYIDGIYKGTAKNFKSPVTSSTQRIKIAGGYNGNHNYDWNGKINDFRIYDHCLSAKEVEEIARGLVLHYKLDNTIISGGNINLALGTNSNSTSTNAWILSMQTGNRTFAIVQDEGINCFQITRGTTEFSGWKYLGYKTFNRTAIKTDTWYTVSFDIKSNQNGTISFTGLTQGNATNYMTTTNKIVNSNQVIANEWSHISLTIKTKSSFDDITIGSQVIYLAPSVSLLSVGNVILLKNMKLEEGIKDTAWSPNPNDSSYITGNYSNNTIYDCSGYDNNGIAASIVSSNESARYNNNITFNGSSSYIKISGNNWMAQGINQMTINLWVKTSSWANNIRLFSCTQSGGFNIEGGSSGYYRFSINVYTNSGQTATAYKYSNTAIKISDLPVDEWVMLTFIYDASKGTDIYINGELYSSYSNISYGIHFNTSARLFLGCEAGTANPETPYFNGQESDFRIYYTALTEEQIKELYNTSATIDKNGNIYAREFDAINTISNPNITKTGIMKPVNIIQERDEQLASIEKDNNILGGHFYEY